jgi:hypothetical protein
VTPAGPIDWKLDMKNSSDSGPNLLRPSAATSARVVAIAVAILLSAGRALAQTPDPQPTGHVSDPARPPLNPFPAEQYLGEQGDMEIRWSPAPHFIAAFNLAEFQPGGFFNHVVNNRPSITANVGLTFRC